ncbi:MAG: transcriptional repressor [Pseudomonadota bacterium]
MKPVSKKELEVKGVVSRHTQQTLEQAEQKCRAKGVQLTKKRKLVLSGLLETEKAMSAYELVEYCKQELGQEIPAMTVYRILEFLEQEHLAHRLNLVNKYVACCQISSDHSHEDSQFFICGKCDRVIEVTLDKSTKESLRQDTQKAGFQIVEPQLEINGVCTNCDH